MRLCREPLLLLLDHGEERGIERAASVERRERLRG
jgi:hypothetical protein